MAYQRPGPPIPAEPFVTWLHSQLGAEPAANSVLAERLGITVRCLYDYLNSRGSYRQHTDTYGRWRVEDMLEHAGLMLTDVYPDLPPEDIELEPDAYCERCRDVVTPIQGVCPWCESRLAPQLQAAA